MFRMSFVLAALMLMLAAGASCTPIMEAVDLSLSGTPITTNGDFSAIAGGQVSGWSPYLTGYTVAPGEGPGGTNAITCENTSTEDMRGICQWISLDRTEIRPLVVAGWSKCENIDGSPDANYSIYVDILYQDGTPLWGKIRPFNTGTHDWEFGQYVIMPDKPIKTLSVYGLLRWRTGKAWFAGMSVRELTDPDSILFDGNLVRPTYPALTRTAQTVASGDGLRLGFQSGAITSVVIGNRRISQRYNPAGFMVRDAAANSGIYGFRPTGRNVTRNRALIDFQGDCSELGLKITSRFRAARNCIKVTGQVTSTMPSDRAVSLYFALPVDADQWTWGEDIKRSHTIATSPGSGTSWDMSRTVDVSCGATGSMSPYPLGAIYDGRTGIALAMDMGSPAIARAAYNRGAGQLYIVFDFGLVPETPAFPRSASFSFSIYQFDPAWGFRSAWQKLTEIYPDYFTVRSRQQGIWMPFSNISTVQNWQDFGFKYHEGSAELSWDAANGVLGFPYVEPSTWWMPMPEGVPRTEEDAYSTWQGYLNDPTAPSYHHDLAGVLDTAGMFRSDDSRSMLFLDTPWCDGAVWSINPCPFLPDQPNGATYYYNEDAKTRHFLPGAPAPAAGQYIDSIEGYVTTDLNYRREHFAHTTVPLTFDTKSMRPALHKGLSVFEMTRWLAADLHGMGKLTFANGVPYRFGWLCSQLDVLGTETNWLNQGAYSPIPDEYLALWRTLSGAKPYVILMNTDYDTFGYDMVENYFQLSLFYGFYPSMFSSDAATSPYWENPAWYNRDRPLFMKYIPIIRELAESGWKPVTHAASSNPSLCAERFGPGTGGVSYITLTNQTDRTQTGTITIQTAALGLPANPRAVEMVNGIPIQVQGGSFAASLAPRQTWAVKMMPTSQ